MKEIKITCIQCPLGCPLTVQMEKEQVLAVKGHTCKRGEIYGQKEVVNPTRTVTSTVKVVGGMLPVVAVKTKLDIPKEKIFECMAQINKVEVKAPIFIGDIIIENVCDTGIDVVATACA